MQKLIYLFFIITITFLNLNHAILLCLNHIKYAFMNVIQCIFYYPYSPVYENVSSKIFLYLFFFLLYAPIQWYRILVWKSKDMRNRKIGPF